MTPKYLFLRSFCKDKVISRVEDIKTQLKCNRIYLSVSHRLAITTLIDDLFVKIQKTMTQVRKRKNDDPDE